MPCHREEQKQPPSKAEMVARLIGLSQQHDEEDLEYWRQATDEMRGKTLHKLLARGRLIRASVGSFFEDAGPRVIRKPRRDDNKS